MSKKNLARTAIEGGRATYNKWDRHQSNREVRSDTRVFMAHINNDIEAADDDVIERRRPVYREFRDRLHPVRRWMDKQVGKNWDAVHSELRTRFDSRNISGQHILFDHMLSDVDPHPYVVSYGFFGSGRYFVDDNGILRERESRRYRKYHVDKSTVSHDKLMAWCGDRFVSEVGNECFWLVPVGSRSPEMEKLGFFCAFRQDAKLSKTERAFYDSLKPFEKRLVQLQKKE